MMTEKRFWYDFEDCNGAKIVDFKEDKEYSLETIGDFQTIEELLNNLHEENQSLKRTIEDNIDSFKRSRSRRIQAEEENEQLKQQLAHHTRMHEWFRNEAYLLQNKLDNREDEIRRLKGDAE